MFPTATCGKSGSALRLTAATGKGKVLIWPDAIAATLKLSRECRRDVDPCSACIVGAVINSL